MTEEQAAELAEVKALFNQKKPPGGLVAHLADYEFQYYTVRVYRDNFDKLALPDQLASMHWINTTIELIRNRVPCYLEVWKRPGSKV